MREGVSTATKTRGCETLASTALKLEAPDSKQCKLNRMLLLLALLALIAAATAEVHRVPLTKVPRVRQAAPPSQHASSPRT